MEGRIKLLSEKLAVSQDQTATIKRLEDEKKEMQEDLDTVSVSRIVAHSLPEFA